MERNKSAMLPGYHRKRTVFACPGCAPGQTEEAVVAGIPAESEVTGYRKERLRGTESRECSVCGKGQANTVIKVSFILNDPDELRRVIDQLRTMVRKGAAR